eukprot:2137761-Ditylum_brightwellii.AAC.1
MAVRDYNCVNATARGKALAETTDDIAGLSELTPLLSMLDLETKGIELCNGGKNKWHLINIYTVMDKCMEEENGSTQ